MKLAAVPLNATEVAPVKFAPLIVTPIPTGPLAGAKVVIVGVRAAENPFKMFAVVCCMRGSTMLYPLKLSNP